LSDDDFKIKNNGAGGPEAENADNEVSPMDGKEELEAPIDRGAEGLEEEAVEKTIEEQLADAEAKAAEYLEGWQRERAELENYRKRVLRDKENWRGEILGDIVNRVLVPLDDFDLAIQNMPEDLTNHDWVTGVVMTHKKFFTQLEDIGLQVIDGQGDEFDPNIHEAVMTVDSDEYDSGTVVEVLRKGYMLGERVIRPALVKVAG